VVSKYSGSSYRDFVEESILLPLGMTSSTLYPDRAFETDKLTQSWTPSGRRIPFFIPESTADLVAGAGGVMSTVKDMVRTSLIYIDFISPMRHLQALWVKMLLNSGVNAQTNATIIPRTTFDLATSAISVANNKGSTSFSLAGYGLGWVRMSYRGHEVSFPIC
jgi:CubicO group peptidase (beta-lactamase class C family)